MIICKFGGKSTTSLLGLRNIKKISQNFDRKVLVFSAIGKGFDKDIKLTDLLINLSLEKNFQKKERILAKIDKKLTNLIKLLHLDIDISEFISQIKRSNNKSNNLLIIKKTKYYYGRFYKRHVQTHV